MCRERKRTRDLLLDYDSTGICRIPRPRTAGLAMVYPWENIALSTLLKQLYVLAADSGFSGTEQEFSEKFGSYFEGKQIIYANYDSFPEEGETDKFYFDLTDKILYYWDNEYIPVNAMLIAGTILNAGDSSYDLED